MVPSIYRQHALQVAHDHPWSGHLGIIKTCLHILKHFFWPALRKDVVQYCQSCCACQSMVKPNQVILPAPLCPIPVFEELFDRVLVDCVGPLPRTMSGNQYLLTIIRAATRFPEAVPLCRITTSLVVKALFFCFHHFWVS